MKTSSISSFPAILIVIFTCSIIGAASAHGHGDFLECLANEFNNYTLFSNIVHTPANSSYTPTLKLSIQNLRFSSESTPKPRVIVTPEQESQIPPVIYCAKENDLEIRTRSGGHDFEGLSYVSNVPFVVIDMIRLDEVTVDTEQRTAWVQSGASVGSLHYRIAEKSKILGFPAGICPTVGVGGHFSGGGYGMMMRKYGFAADHIIDARIVGVDGRILDRESMGEDLFWAIRGGGGSSFGVILAWKIQLVDVPEIVTVFALLKTLEQNATQLIHKWQYVAHKLDKDILIRVIMRKTSPTDPITVWFVSVFLGGIDRLLPLMQQSFPELGLLKADCTEMSWIDSVLHFSMLPKESRHEALLDRIQPFTPHFKVKSDYVKKPIPENGFEGIWKFFNEIEAAEVGLIPFGGRMDEISESSIPFPQRAGIIFSVEYIVFWGEEGVKNTESYINWIRRLYSYMTPYVSNSPRAAYINYRDLDLGMNANNKEMTSYEEASIWGIKYFKNNFDRLVRVKTMIDPENFFKDEQSIPPIQSLCTEKKDQEIFTSKTNKDTLSVY